MSNDDGNNSQKRLRLYDEKVSILLRNAYEFAKNQDNAEQQRQQRSTGGDNRVIVFPAATSRGNDSVVSDNDDNCGDNSNYKRKNVDNYSDDDSDEGKSLSTIASEYESDNNENNGSKSDEELVSKNVSSAETKSSPTLKGATKPPKLSTKQQKRLMQDTKRHASNLSRLDFPTGVAAKGKPTGFLHLFPAAALLSKDSIREPANVVDQAKSYMILSEKLSSSSSSSSSIIIVLLIQSGRFAGGVFRCGVCLSHRATTRYTVRKGQGKAQSAQDSSRRPKSIGSQLRRAGEQQLDEDVRTTLNEWTNCGYIENCQLILVGCPKSMRSTVFSDNDDGLLSKIDKRIRKVPFDYGRATYMSVEIVYTTLMDVYVRDVLNLTANQKTEVDESKMVSDTDISSSIAVAGNKSSNDENPDTEKQNRKEILASQLPMTKLHEAARDGNLIGLMSLLNNINKDGGCSIDQPAGYECMTPLHFASSSTVDPVTSSAVVSALLIHGADPTIHDACGRPPYFIARHEKIREAFRKARAVLGEDFCEWDIGGKVGPPLTEEDQTRSKAKEAEKKRRKKARQKEKKAKDKSKAQAAETEREANKAAEEAMGKPITSTNVCDFCQKICKGRNARQNMFRRLDYKYCSSKCVQGHKRELIAAAAIARCGGN